jgi:hypothetical protein
MPRIAELFIALTGKPFYSTSSRHRSMVADYATLMNRTYAPLGQSTVSLQQGVNEAVFWLNAQP